MRELLIIALLILAGLAIAEAPRRYDEWVAAEKRRQIQIDNAKIQREVNDRKRTLIPQSYRPGHVARW